MTSAPNHLCFEAVLMGDLEGLRRALAAGAALDARTTAGRTPLMLAARHGRLALVRHLVQAGADPDALIDDGRDTTADVTIMDFGEGGPSFAELVLQRVAELEQARPSVLPAAAASAAGPPTPTLRRFEEPPDPPPDGFGPYDLATPLNLALLYGHTEVALELLRAGASPQGDDWRSTPPLALAAAVGNLEALEALLAAGASPDRGFDHTPLEAAAAHGHLEIARSLLRAGARIDVEGEDSSTALQAAAAAGQLAMVQLLVEHGANPARGGAQRCALSRAAENGHQAVVDFLEPLVPAELRTSAPEVATGGER